MKNKFLFPILLLGLLTLYFSCQKEDDSIVQREQSAQRTLTKKILSKKEIDSNIRVSELLSVINSNANNQKSLAYDSSNDLYIDTEEAIYLEEGDNHSYTFYVYSLENNSVLKNIVLSINAEGSYDTHLWTYYNNGVDDIDSETQIDVVKLENFDGNGILSKIDPTTGCSNGEISYVEVDWMDSSGAIYDEWTDCPDANDCDYFGYWLPCPNTGGGSIGNDSGSDGSSDNGSSDNDSGNYDSGIDDGGNNNGGSTSGPSGGSTSGDDNDPNPVITTPKKKDGSDASGSFLISAIGEENLTSAQIDWINNTNEPNINNLLISIIVNNGSSDDYIELVIRIIDPLRDETLITISPFFKYPDGSNYANVYPELTILLSEYIPYLKDNIKLINTISYLTGLDNEEILDDFTWNEGPEVHIEQLGNNDDGEEIKGKFNPLEPNKIVIDIDLVNSLEALASIENPTQEQSQQLQLFDGLITFAVCLHEYVHFADFAFDGTMQDNENLELGLLFEEIFVGGYYEIDPDGNVVIIPTN